MAPRPVRIASAALAAAVLSLATVAPAQVAAAATISLVRHPWPGPDSGWSTQAATTVTTLASTTESTGVVLIETVVDYGSGAAAGTGLVLDSSGIVITNHHVVEGSTAIEVTDPATDQTWTAEVVGYDATTDVAVLELVDASGLATVETDSATVDDGQPVTAVGNSEGGGVLTAAQGEVTDPDTDITVQADDGSEQDLTDLIEVAAQVVSGDSGGALLDGDGEVIGMTVAASSDDSSGYAIPIATVLAIADQVLDGDASGAVTLGYGAALGVQLATGSGELLVAGVVADGAAAKAGVTAGSVITSIDGTAVSTYDEVTGVLSRLAAGERARITWLDADGTKHSATATLGRAPVA
ncbi:MAG TPA: trypsin-like peptidase domain-containing protein [Propionicimonas sp.]|nr:trypsin-like peptidase domain-containing protein [Propionicimonas sp.]